MIKFFVDFRSTTPYKIGSILCCLLSIITIVSNSFVRTNFCDGEAVLLALPAMFILSIIRSFNTWLFFLFNFIALIWVFLNSNGNKTNIIADISYFISICSLFL